MACKRSSVRFRLAPPPTFMRTKGSPHTSRLLKYFRGLCGIASMIAVSVKRYAADFCARSCDFLRPSKRFSQIPMGINAETGSSRGRDGFDTEQNRLIQC